MDFENLNVTEIAALAACRFGIPDRMDEAAFVGLVNKGLLGIGRDGELELTSTGHNILLNLDFSRH